MVTSSIGTDIFFRLILLLIKGNYFKGGLKEEVADEYIMCGKVMGLSMIQRGNIPRTILFLMTLVKCLCIEIFDNFFIG